MPQCQDTYLGPVTMSGTEINESTLRNNPHFFFEHFQVGGESNKMLWTRAGVYEHLFSILEGLDIISNVLKEREEGRERERGGRGCPSQECF